MKTVSLAEIMDKIAANGWCVMLKRMPPGSGWIAEGSRSEHDSPSEDREIGKDKWCVELSDMNFIMGKGPYRNNVFDFGVTAEEALSKSSVRAEQAQKAGK